MKKIKFQLKIGLLVWAALIIGGIISYAHHSPRAFGLTAFSVGIVGTSSWLCSLGMRIGCWEGTKKILGLFVSILTFVVLMYALTQRPFLPVPLLEVQGAILLVWGLVYLQNKLGCIVTFHFGFYLDGLQTD